MKKYVTLPGPVAILLIAGLMFATGLMSAACLTDGGKPALGNLPALPDNTAYVANETEALALLTALKPALEPMMDQVEELVQLAEDSSESGNWHITDADSIPGLEITSRRSFTDDIYPDNFMDNGWDPEVGHYARVSADEETIADFTAHQDASGVVIYQGSKVMERNRSTSDFDTINVLDEGVSIHANGPAEASTVYALTVSDGERGGKIILDAGQKISASYDFVYPDDTFAPLITYSGSLNVYGANDEALYTLRIHDEETYEEAMDYFETFETFAAGSED